MGTNVRIKLKTVNDQEIVNFNNILNKMGIKNNFISEQMNIDWVEDINTNPDSYQKHLKPITLEELKETFENYTELGVLEFDVAFSRTSQEEAELYADFILNNIEHIERIKNGDELKSRYDLNKAQIEAIMSRNVAHVEPVKLPVEEQYIPTLQGGRYLCKTFSPKKMWVVFGNVDKPTFMKVRIYEDELYNYIYRDKKGYAYMLLPLIPISNNMVDFVSDVYTKAFELGLREDFNLIMSYLYGLELTNIDLVAEQFKEYYTQDELLEHFKTMFIEFNTTHGYNNLKGFIWRDNKKQFIPIGFGTTTPTNIVAKCNLLTALVRSLNSNVVADTMTELTSTKYIGAEFKM